MQLHHMELSKKPVDHTGYMDMGISVIESGMNEVTQIHRMKTEFNSSKSEFNKKSYINDSVP